MEDEWRNGCLGWVGWFELTPRTDPLIDEFRSCGSLDTRCMHVRLSIDELMRSLPWVHIHAGLRYRSAV